MKRPLASVIAAALSVLGCKSEDRAPSVASGSEQGLIVQIPLGAAGFGTEDDRSAVLELEAALVDVMKADPQIEVDGHEFGEGRAVLYLYGPDADEMFRLAKPLLAQFPSTGPKTITRRYGSVFDPGSKEVVTSL